MKITRYPCQILMKVEVKGLIFAKYSNIKFMITLSVGAEFHAVG